MRMLKNEWIKFSVKSEEFWLRTTQYWPLERPDLSCPPQCLHALPCPSSGIHGINAVKPQKEWQQILVKKQGVSIENNSIFHHSTHNDPINPWEGRLRHTGAFQAGQVWPLKYHYWASRTPLDISPLITHFLDSWAHCEPSNGFSEQGVQDVLQEVTAKTWSLGKNCQILWCSQLQVLNEWQKVPVKIKEFQLKATLYWLLGRPDLSCPEKHLVCQADLAFLKGQYWVVLNWDYLFFARICCHSFHGFTTLIPWIPEMGKARHADSVVSKTDLADLRVNIGLFSIGHFWL